MSQGDVNRVELDKNVATISGRHLGEWIVGAQIGAGGFADVFTARQPRLERDAVIKVLRQRDINPMRVQLFEREARMASQLDHPYAAHVYSFGVEPDGLWWIAMELVRGKSLARLLQETGSIPVNRFIPLFERLCEVVHSAHEVGLIHRDIKPANVMVITRAGRLLPKLLDFGIAQLAGVTVPETSSTPTAGVLAPATYKISDKANLVHNIDSDTDKRSPWETTEAAPPSPGRGLHGLRSGTPAYMSPEQWHASPQLDHRADIYSLGVLAHQCLTGELPFRNIAPHYSMLDVEVYPDSLGDEFPPALAQAILKALAPNPGNRFVSALDFGRAVRSATTIEKLPRLSHEELSPWLLQAPTHLGDALGRFEIETGREACDALGQFLLTLSQWIGVLAMAAHASKGPRLIADADLLRQKRQSIRNWIDLAKAICQPYKTQPEDFPIPELASWLTQNTSTHDYLYSLASMSSTEDKPSEAIFGLLRALLRSLQFLCNYSLLQQHLILLDGEGTELFDLAPLVFYQKPTPDSKPELFVIAGSQNRMLMTSPRGFEIQSEAIDPWLEHFFCLGSTRPELVEETDSGPYRGLGAFSQSDSAMFFGRNREVQQLFNRLMGHSFVALTGPSGSGKSSLVAAGLIPILPSHWSVVSFRPGNAPLVALATALGELPYGVGELRYASEMIGEWLKSERRKLLISIDQAEELLTLSTPSDAHSLASFLVGLLASPRVRLLISIRDDFIAAAASIEPWREMFSAGVVLIGKPTREELYNMVVGPAQRVGYRFDDPTLAAQMVDEVASEAVALPLISFAASQLWAHRDSEQRLLLRVDYEKMGGVAGALAGYAEGVLAALPTGRQTLVRSLFRRLVTREGTRAVVRASELATTQAEYQIIEHLVSARLLVAAEGPEGHETITLIHEALLTRWPRLARWRLEDDEAVRFRAELRAATITWNDRQCDPSYLWSGAALRNLDEFVANSGEHLSPNEEAFAHASRIHRSRKGRLRWISALVGFGVLLTALIVVFALKQSAEANRVRAETRLTQMLAARGLTEVTAHRSLRALPYLHAAYQRGDDSLSIQIGLSLALASIPKVRAAVNAHKGSVSLISNSPNDYYLTHAPGENPRLWHWNKFSFESLASFEHEDTQIASIANEGRRIVTTSLHRIKFWKPNGKLIKEVKQKGFIGAIGFHPEDHHMVMGDSDAIVVWDLDGHRIATLGEQKLQASITGLAFSRDGALLAAARTDNKIQLWDYSARTLLHEIELNAKPVSLSFVGKLVETKKQALLVGLDDGSVVRVDSMLGTITLKRTIGPTAIYLQCQTGDRCLAFSPSAKILSVIDSRTLAPLTTIAATSNRITGVQSTDGKRLVALDGQRVRVFDGTSYQELGSQTLGKRPTSSIVSSDNQTLVVSSFDGQLTALDITKPDIQTIFKGHNNKRPGRDGTPNQVWSAQFMPGADRIASFDNYEILLWTPDNGKIVKRIALDGRTPVGFPRLSVSRDGDQLLLPDHRQADVFDVKTGLRIAKFSDDSIASAMSWTNDYVITGTRENRSNHFYLSAWDRDSEELIAERNVPSMVFALEGANETGIVYYCLNGEIGRWDFVGDTSWSKSVATSGYLAVSPDGRLLSAGTRDGNIYIWEAVSGKLHRRLRAPTSSTFAVAFGPQGRLLATGSLDLSLWDIEKGVAIGRLTGHTSPVRSIDISSDGSHIVSVDNASKVLVRKIEYEKRTPVELGEIIAKKVPLKLDGVELVPTENR